MDNKQPKKIDILLKFNNMPKGEVERMYGRLCRGENPLQPTMIMFLKQEIVKELGYTPKVSK